MISGRKKDQIKAMLNDKPGLYCINNFVTYVTKIIVNTGSPFKGASIINHL